MEKRIPLDNTSPKEPSPAPVVLTTEEAKQIAGGLAASVASINVRCCLTCGIGGVYRAT
jgi:hypothetical protein